MQNKLVFDGNTTYYEWDKYQIDTIRTYIWNKYNLDIDYIYNWDQFNAVESTEFHWDMYNVATALNYIWKKYNVTQANRYTWNKNEVLNVPTYHWDRYTSPTETTYTWEKYGVSEEARTFWEKFYAITTTTYTWDKYEVGSVYKWDKSTAIATTTYGYDKFNYIDSSTSYHMQLEMDSTFLHLHPYGGASGGTSDLSKAAGHIPDFTVTLTDVDLAQYTNHIMELTSMNVECYPDHEVENNDFSTGGWSCRLNGGGYTDRSYDRLTSGIVYKRSGTSDVIGFAFNYTNVWVDIQDYYLYIPGYSYRNNGESVFHNVLHIQFNTTMGRDTYTTTRYDNNYTGVPKIVSYDQTNNTTHYLVDNKSFFPVLLSPVNGIAYSMGDGVAPFYTDPAHYTTHFTTQEKLIDGTTGYITEDGKKYYLSQYTSYSSYKKGEFIENVYDTTSSAYPSGGRSSKDGYWYDNKQSISGPTTLVEQVSSTNQTEYPYDGIKDGYWYSFDSSETVTTKGASTGEEVSSEDPTAYPNDGYQNGYWYVFDRTQEGEQKADYIEDVESTQRAAYPDDGIQDDYWYIYKSSRTYHIKGTFEESVSSSTESTYPVNGYNVYDDKWYTKTETTYTQTPGAAAGQVESLTRSDYPDDGIQEGYWYTYTGYREVDVRGTDTGEIVTSLDGEEYPADGKQGDYWYVYDRNEPTQVKGTFISEVTSEDRDAYPDDGIEGGKWYVYQASSTGWKKGTPTGRQVSSADSTTYPNDGYKKGYWYVTAEPTPFYVRGSLIDQVEDSDPDAYPQNAIQGDYWFTFYNYRDTRQRGTPTGLTVTSTNRNAYPQDNYQDGYWYVLTGSEARGITIQDDQLYGGCQYQSDINDGNDLCPGTVSSAQVSFETNEALTTGLSFKYYKRYSADDEWSFVDKFIVMDVNKTPYEDYYKVVAYDYMSLFELVVDDWIPTVTYPVTLTTVYQSLIQYIATQMGVAITYESSNIGPNTNLTVENGYTGSNITGRNVLEWIAQLAGRSIRIKSTENNIMVSCPAWTLATYNSKPENRVSITMSEDIAELPTKVTVKSMTNDIGQTVGSGTASYEVVGNPLVNGASSTTLSAYASGILSELAGIGNYHSGTLKMLYDEDLPLGTKVTVYAADGITQLGAILVMHKKFGRDGVTFTSDGQATRDTQSNVTNSQIQAVLGKFNELSSTVERNSAKITDLETGFSSIEQTVENIETTVQGVDGRVTNLVQTVDGLSTHVQGLDNRSTTLEQTANSLAIAVSHQPTTQTIQTQINNSLNVYEPNVNEVTTTTGYTFNANGLTISNSSSDIYNTIDNTGMEVRTSSETLLRATNQGVDAYKFAAKKYITVADIIHLEEYDENKIGCFWALPD